MIREDVDCGGLEATFRSGVIDRDSASILNVSEGNFAFIEMDRDRSAEFELMLASVGRDEHEGACAGLLQDADETL